MRRSLQPDWLRWNYYLAAVSSHPVAATRIPERSCHISSAGRFPRVCRTRAQREHGSNRKRGKRGRQWEGGRRAAAGRCVVVCAAARSRGGEMQAKAPCVHAL
jgi:hypothetical protein